MSLLSKKEIAELHEINQKQCISIFIPTHRAGKKVLQKEDRLYLKVQLQTVKKELAKTGLHQKTIDTITAPVQQLIDDSSFWRQQSDGLAIFIAENFFQKYTLPIHFKGFNYIGDSFYLKPLMPLFVGDGFFYLMTLEISNVHLYECTRHSITEIIIDDLIPENPQDRVGYDYEEKNLQFRTQQAGIGQVMYHGQEAATGKRKNEIKKYLRAINNGIRPLLKDDSIPLIVASQDYLFDIYKGVNTYKNYFDQNINGNFNNVDILEVHEWAWKKISPTFDKKRKDKITRFIDEQGTGKTDTGIGKILPKAFEGKIDTLFCENLADIFGTYKVENDIVIATETEEKEASVSLMNLAAIETFLNGGTVYLLDKKDMPNPNSKINALYRY